MTTGNSTALQRAVDLVSAIFIPLLGLLAGTGLLKAFLALSFQLGWMNPESSNAIIIDTVSNSFFYALPVMLAYTSAKVFKAHVLTALTLGFAVIYPNLIELLGSGRENSFLGLPVPNISYASSVLPIVVAVWVLSHVERALKRLVPQLLQDFLVPALALLIMVPTTLIVIGPGAMAVGKMLGAPLSYLFSAFPPIGTVLAGMFFGGVFQLLQIFGLHWGIVPLMIQEVSENGFSLMQGPVLAAMTAQAAATFAVVLRARSNRLRSVAVSASIATFFAGVGEPTLYGVLLPLRRPLIASCVGGALGGAIVAVGGVASSSFVLPGLLAIPAFLGHGSTTALLVGVLVAMAVSFGLALVLGFDVESDTDRTTTAS
ncbi:PTS transporter subunit EIIC [Actinomycetaceae bacterium L2_0104]